MEKGTDPKFALLVRLWRRMSYWRWPKSKKNVRKNFSHWAIQIKAMSESRLYLFSPFRENMIAFYTIWAIFGRKQGGVTGQRVRIKVWNVLFHTHDPGQPHIKKMFPALYSFGAIGHKQHFRKMLSCILKFGCFSCFSTPAFLKTNHLDIIWLILNRLAPILNPKNENPKIALPFLIALFHFETNLIKQKFFLFFRQFWTVASFLPNWSETQN